MFDVGDVVETTSLRPRTLLILSRDKTHHGTLTYTTYDVLEVTQGNMGYWRNQALHRSGDWSLAR